MPIIERSICDKCKSFLDDGVEAYCESCYSDLNNKVMEQEELIKNLENRLSELETEIERVNDILENKNKEK